jgi:hypothetical protein
MMEVVRTSETSVDNHFTRQYNPEDSSERLEYFLMKRVVKDDVNVEYGFVSATSHFHIGLGSFREIYPPEFCTYALFVSVILATCAAHHILPNFVILRMQETCSIIVFLIIQYPNLLFSGSGR